MEMAFRRTKAEAFFGQEFESLKLKCEASGSLFEDPLFPSDEKSLFFSHSASSHLSEKKSSLFFGHSASTTSEIVWKRAGVSS